MFRHLGKRLLKTTLFLPRIRKGLLRTSLKYKIGEIPSHVSRKEAIGNKNIYKHKPEIISMKTSPDKLIYSHTTNFNKRPALPLSSRTL